MQIHNVLEYASVKVFRVIQDKVDVCMSLINAVIEGNLESVKKALSEGISVNYVNYEDEEANCQMKR